MIPQLQAYQDQILCMTAKPHPIHFSPLIIISQITIKVIGTKGTQLISKNIFTVSPPPFTTLCLSQVHPPHKVLSAFVHA